MCCLQISIFLQKKQLAFPELIPVPKKGFATFPFLYRQECNVKNSKAITNYLNPNVLDIFKTRSFLLAKIH